MLQCALVARPDNVDGEASLGLQSGNIRPHMHIYTTQMYKQIQLLNMLRSITSNRACQFYANYIYICVSNGKPTLVLVTINHSQVHSRYKFLITPQTHIRKQVNNV